MTNLIGLGFIFYFILPLVPEGQGLPYFVAALAFAFFVVFAQLASAAESHNNQSESNMISNISDKLTITNIIKLGLVGMLAYWAYNKFVKPKLEQTK